MKTKWQVERCSLRGYGGFVTVTAHAELNHEKGRFSETAGLLQFHIESGEARNWYAGQIFDLEIPYVPPVSHQDHPSLRAVGEERPDDEEPFVEEYGNGAGTRGLFGRKH